MKKKYIDSSKAAAKDGIYTSSKKTELKKKDESPIINRISTTRQFVSYTERLQND